MYWLALALLLWAGMAVFFWSLCAAAARGDQDAELALLEYVEDMADLDEPTAEAVQ